MFSITTVRHICYYALWSTRISDSVLALWSSLFGTLNIIYTGCWLLSLSRPHSQGSRHSTVLMLRQGCWWLDWGPPMTVACLFLAFQATSDDHPWDDYLCSALFAQQTVCWPVCVHVTVAVAHYRSTSCSRDIARSTNLRSILRNRYQLSASLSSSLPLLAKTNAPCSTVSLR